MGRPAKKSDEEKAAEKLQKDAEKQAAAELQSRSDLELLRLAKQHNPFKFTVNKRVPTWQTIAREMNLVVEVDGKGYDDRRCRERVSKLMKDFRARPPSGTGTDAQTEAKELLEFLKQEEDLTLNNQHEVKEKEEKSRALANKIQQTALQRLGTKSLADFPDIRAAEELEEQFPDGIIPKRFKRGIVTSPDNPVLTYKRRQNIDPTAEYLAQKREQQLEEMRLKKEMQEQEMKDRAEERVLKKDAIAFEREKLAMDDKERERRFQLEREERAQMMELLKSAINKKND